ncbi:MAG TPA: TatD family deoxyribonuclease [Candidatus Korarchaeota archaeon]|nr:TatD family deoxyribonuclease [Candidatus Korarchaeota archaeon]
MFVDVHCHLYMIENLEILLDRAEELDVKCLITNSEDLESCRRNVELIRDERVYGAFGLHPQFAHRKEDLPKIEEFLKLDKAVAVGEIGLDYKYARNNPTKELQKKVFEEQVRMAMERDLPVIVHSRYAHKPVIEILEKIGAEKVVLHWFSGSADLVERALVNGWFLSLGPFCLNPQYEKTIAMVPLERMLLETDSPVPFRGRAVDPTWVPLVAKRIAEVKGINLTNVEVITKENSKRLFRLHID